MTPDESTGTWWNVVDITRTHSKKLPGETTQL